MNFAPFSHCFGKTCERLKSGKQNCFKHAIVWLRGVASTRDSISRRLRNFHAIFSPFNQHLISLYFVLNCLSKIHCKYRNGKRETKINIKTHQRRAPSLLLLLFAIKRSKFENESTSRALEEYKCGISNKQAAFLRHSNEMFVLDSDNNFVLSSTSISSEFHYQCFILQMSLCQSSYRIQIKLRGHRSIMSMFLHA